MSLPSTPAIELALTRLGEQLAFEGELFAVVIVGGAALNLLGVVQRETADVDILAFAIRLSAARAELQEPPEPMPPALERAVTTVARDMGLDQRWMNTGPALQWRQGLPAGLDRRVTWSHYGPRGAPEMGLDVGLVARQDLIFFKLYAAVDHASPRSVHYKDLLALAPTPGELDAAAAWVREQDPTPEFHEILDHLVAHVRHQLEHD